MKKKDRFIFISLLLTAVVLSACENNEQPAGETFSGIEGITFDNYPKVDCSTSARAVSVSVACKLLGIPCSWREPLVDEWEVAPDYDYVPEEYKDFFWQTLMFSKTGGAFLNLIDGKADLILTHRTISPDEKAHADELGVTLIEKAIALDAFVFIVNKNNPVKSLTVSQVQKIYTGEITNWAEVEGNKAKIKVFTRPRNSGSEEIFRTLVMKDLEPAEFPESEIGSMVWVFNEILDNENAICYTFNNYKDLVARKPDSEVPKIAINGVFPDETTVKNGTFPFIAEVHVAIRSDLDHNSMAYRLFEWLQTTEVNSVLTDCGFIPKNK